MGIYKKTNSGGKAPGLSKKRLVLFGIAIIALLLLFLVLSSLTELLKPKPVIASFANPVLDLSKEQSTVLKVRVFNPTNDAVDNSVISILPVDSASLLVFPGEQQIPRIGGNEFREFLFSVRPNPGIKPVSGSYKIRVIFQLGTAQFEEQVLLQIKAV